MSLYYTTIEYRQRCAFYFAPRKKSWNRLKPYLFGRIEFLFYASKAINCVYRIVLHSDNWKNYDNWLLWPLPETIFNQALTLNQILYRIEWNDVSMTLFQEQLLFHNLSMQLQMELGAQPLSSNNFIGHLQIHCSIISKVALKNDNYEFMYCPLIITLLSVWLLDKVEYFNFVSF